VRFELQYKRAAACGGAGGDDGGWHSLVATGPAFEVGSLAAGTKYAFRGRGGAVNYTKGPDGGTVEEVAWGKWSVESVYATAGEGAPG
jgi:hypothetical protein